jgi:hypothetical protein
MKFLEPLSVLALQEIIHFRVTLEWKISVSALFEMQRNLKPKSQDLWL